MVKIRRESNEDLAPFQRPPVKGINLEVERLEQLRRVTYKAKVAAKSKRIIKPRKKA